MEKVNNKKNEKILKLAHFLNDELSFLGTDFTNLCQ